jgi:hypothetical protein
VLRHFTYVSSATQPFDAAELAALLDVSRTNNERDDITGMLLYKGGNFMQTVEGSLEAVELLRARLGGDPRHNGLMVLIEGTRPQRLFDGWTMGFRDLAGEDLSDVPGYSEFLDTPLTADAFGEDPDASQRLLLSFKRNMQR